MNCGPVLQSVQPDRCLEQPPDQLRDHRAIVGVQDLVIRQGGLAARFLHQLLLPVDQGVAVVRQLLGQPPGFGDQVHARLQGCRVSSFVLSGQGQGADRLCGDLQEKFLRRGMPLDLRHFCSPP